MKLRCGGGGVGPSDRKCGLLSLLFTMALPVAPLGGPPPAGDLPVLPVLAPPAGCPVNPAFVAPPGPVVATVNVQNRQLVWQLLQFEARIPAAQRNTSFFFALVRARNSVKNAAACVHAGNYWNCVWINRSRQGAYILHVVRHIFSTFTRANQPQCMRQFPHSHPGKTLCVFCSRMMSA